MIKFSIVTVAKGRYDTFQRVCRSIWELAKNPDEIEHIIMYDDGDQDMEDFLSNYSYIYPQYHIKYYPVKLDDYENRNMHRDYWNPGARLAQGQVVFGLCNDAVITTQDYDEIILGAIRGYSERFHHSVWQIIVDDDSGNHVDGSPVNWFCSWIILTSAAVEVMDGLAPKELPFQGADRAVYTIFANGFRPAIINLKQYVKTEHISHYTGRTEVDEITKHRPKNFNNPCVLSMNQLEYYISKLNDRINEDLLK